jgi:predicted nucleic acid-binding protein
LKRRVVVPDTSVIVAALFPEMYSRAASKLVSAIERQAVAAIAPHALIHEFLSVSSSMTSRRSGRKSIDGEVVEAQVEQFFELTRVIDFVRETQIQRQAWRLMQDEGISPPDSWMLACAISGPDAELWVSHEHRDGFVETARRCHRRVFTLASDASELP